MQSKSPGVGRIRATELRAERSFWRKVAAPIGPLLAVSLALATAPASPSRGLAELTLGGKPISIDYGRPDLAGRNLLALARPGMVWRLGMNKATTLSSAIDLDFGSAIVRRGQYSLFAKKEGASEWVLRVNSQTDLWGTSGYDEKMDVATIPLQSLKLDSPVDKLTIVLAKRSDRQGSLLIQWGGSELRADFRVIG